MIKTLERATRKRGLVINKEKTKYMTISIGNENIDTELVCISEVDRNFTALMNLRIWECKYIIINAGNRSAGFFKSFQI